MAAASEGSTGVSPDRRGSLCDLRAPARREARAGSRLGCGRVVDELFRLGESGSDIGTPFRTAGSVPGLRPLEAGRGVETRPLLARIAPRGVRYAFAENIGPRRARVRPPAPQRPPGAHRVDQTMGLSDPEHGSHSTGFGGRAFSSHARRRGATGATMAALPSSSETIAGSRSSRSVSQVHKAASSGPTSA